MRTYQVGGCVRDRLLGLEPKDIDFVVVGGSEQAMLDLGFKKVGADFPVFLHPESGEEYALARKERKTAAGYNGFEVVFDSSVTLEEDLSRRDLTINAMAQDIVTGEIIDPFGGQKDLKQRLLRHVSDAFAEDPVRVLRTARFAARYGFTVVAETNELMCKVAQELNFVPQERIWTEIQKGLMEAVPRRMFVALFECGALDVEAMLPYRSVDIDCLSAVKNHHTLQARFALCASAFTDKDYERMCIPSDCARVAKAFNSIVEDLMFYLTSSAKERVQILNKVRAFSSEQPLTDVLDAFTTLKAKGVLTDHIVRQVWTDRASMVSVDAAAIAASCKNGSEIKAAIDAARAAALQV